MEHDVEYMIWAFSLKIFYARYEVTFVQEKDLLQHPMFCEARVKVIWLFAMFLIVIHLNGIIKSIKGALVMPL